MPAVDDLLELDELPSSRYKWIVAIHSRRINVHELELKDHIELVLGRKDISRKSMHVVSERCLADGNQTFVFWGQFALVRVMH